MYTSVLLVALSGIVPQGNIEEAPSWQRDYGIARLVGQMEVKPLAVVFGKGDAGWDKLASDGSLAKDVNRLLSQNYVCLYVNLDTDAGREMANAFAISGSRGLVISDRTGKVQAFYHDGGLSNQDLAWYLRRYADPNHVVAVTERDPGAAPSYTSSYYQPAPPPAAPRVQLPFRNC